MPANASKLYCSVLQNTKVKMQQVRLLYRKFFSITILPASKIYLTVKMLNDYETIFLASYIESSIM